MLKSLSLRDFCGHKDSRFEFGDFACLVGDNGIGKTTVLNAVSLLTSSLDFSRGIEPSEDMTLKGFGAMSAITPLQRTRAYLRPNIRHVGQPGGAIDFEVRGVFELDGKDHEVVLTKDGFQKNELVTSPSWWAGFSYFAKFDSDMVNFQLRMPVWKAFAKAFSGITGYDLEPDVYRDSDLTTAGEDPEVVVGFTMHKDGGQVYSRRASAGEKKLAKSLSQMLNLPPDRQPRIVLVDNMEMHVHRNRHLKMFAEIRELFAGKQVIATTHSESVIREYQPREHIIDLDLMKGSQNGNHTKA
jgi:energy-coupling factor transporter ATP-binding protein EcfA2